jgi:hypothetical protein
MKNDKQYPFDEGDTYYTIEGGQIVESTWDFVSEEMYDECGDKYKYFGLPPSIKKELLGVTLAVSVKGNICAKSSLAFCIY